MIADVGYREFYARRLFEKHGAEGLRLPWEQLKGLVAGELAMFEPSNGDVLGIAHSLRQLVRQTAPRTTHRLTDLRQTLFGNEEVDDARSE